MVSEQSEVRGAFGVTHHTTMCISYITVIDMDSSNDIEDVWEGCYAPVEEESAPEEDDTPVCGSWRQC